MKDHKSGDGKSAWHLAAPFVVAIVAMAAAALLYRNLRQYDYSELAESVAETSYIHLALAIGWAAASYLCLTGFDYLALRYVRKPLPYKLAAFVSFVALSIGHNLGVAFLSSGAIRYRFYSRAGLTVEEVAKVIAFCGVTVALGLSTLAGVALLLRTDIASEVIGVPDSVVSIIALACLALPLLYSIAALIVRKPLRVRRLTLEMPGTCIALMQVAIGSLNFACVAACLHSAITAFFDAPYLTVAAVYVIANVAALISHVPGGLGVIETVILYLLPQVQLVAAVLVFRFVYFLLPLGFGGTLFLIREIWLRGQSRVSFGR